MFLKYLCFENVLNSQKILIFLVTLKILITKSVNLTLTMIVSNFCWFWYIYFFFHFCSCKFKTIILVLVFFFKCSFRSFVSFFFPNNFQHNIIYNKFIENIIIILFASSREPIFKQSFISQLIFSSSTIYENDSINGDSYRSKLTYFKKQQIVIFFVFRNY